MLKHCEKRGPKVAFLVWVGKSFLFKRACHLPFLFAILAISLPHWSIIGTKAFQWSDRKNKNLLETQAQSGYTKLLHP
jgi:hypothetical protein